MKGIRNTLKENKQSYCETERNSWYAQSVNGKYFIMNKFLEEIQEQPEALRTDRERVVTVVLREVQGQREVQPEQVREVVHQPEQEAEQQEVQERQEMVHQREILQPGQAENQLAAKVPRSRTP